MRRIIFVALTTALLSGCGGLVRVAYNNGGYAVRVIANEYFDLQGEQTDLFNGQFARVHEWHRREELPIYADVFRRAADELSQGLAREDVVWAIREVRTRYTEFVEQATEESVPLVATLNDDNFAALDKKFSEANAKFAKQYLSGDQTKRNRARAKSLEERFEMFLGDLSDEQRGLIARFVESQPRISQVRFEDRKRRQQELAQLLRQHQTSPDLALRLRNYFVHWERDRGPEHAKLAREWEERLIALILDMDRTLTSEQRAHAVQRFRSYAEDCVILARQGRSSAEARAAITPVVNPTY
jgi:Family of unknown function (DUF6279)/Prokaryotic membrane lipoprotein lipid attachment site